MSGTTTSRRSAVVDTYVSYLRRKVDRDRTEAHPHRARRRVQPARRLTLRTRLAAGGVRRSWASCVGSIVLVPRSSATYLIGQIDGQLVAARAARPVPPAAPPTDARPPVSRRTVLEPLRRRGSPTAELQRRCAASSSTTIRPSPTDTDGVSTPRDVHRSPSTAGTGQTLPGPVVAAPPAVGRGRRRPPARRGRRTDPPAAPGPRFRPQR